VSREATSINLRPRTTLSRNMHITPVPGSSPRNSRKSTSSMLTLLPTDTNLLKLEYELSRNMMRLIPTPPDWLTMEMRPGSLLRNVRNGRHRPFSALMRVSPLGPTKRMPWSIAFCAMMRVSSSPSLPSSEKPPEGIASRLIPMRAQSSIMPGTADAGTNATARSTGPGISSREA